MRRSSHPLVAVLTGSMGMGKSAAGRHMREGLGLPLFDADRFVHETLYSATAVAEDEQAQEQEEARRCTIEGIRSLCPSAVVGGAEGEGGDARVVDRAVLSRWILHGSGGEKSASEGKDERLRAVEEVVHPYVRLGREAFAARERREDRPGGWKPFAMVYDIPLFFESAQQPADVDEIFVVSAAREVQRTRVMARPGMTEEKFAYLDSRQVPDEEKRRRATQVIKTDYDSRSFSEMKAQIAQSMQRMIEAHPAAWKSFTQQQKQAVVLPDYRVHEAVATEFDSIAEDGPLRDALLNRFGAITFDVDETLCESRPAVQSGLAAMTEFLEAAEPRVAGRLSEDLMALARDTAQRFPLIAHDFTELRLRTLRRVLANVRSEQRHGQEDDTVGEQEDDEEVHAIAKEAVDVFVRARSEAVEKSLYADVLPVLQDCKDAGLKVGLVTESNTDFSQCPRLRACADFVVRASDVGARKRTSRPGEVVSVPFVAAAHLAQVPPSRIVHVGDSRSGDILPSLQCAMTAIYLHRSLDTVGVDPRPPSPALFGAATATPLVSGDDDDEDDDDDDDAAADGGGGSGDGTAGSPSPPEHAGDPAPECRAVYCIQSLFSLKAVLRELVDEVS